MYVIPFWIALLNGSYYSIFDWMLPLVFNFMNVSLGLLWSNLYPLLFSDKEGYFGGANKFVLVLGSFCTFWSAIKGRMLFLIDLRQAESVWI